MKVITIYECECCGETSVDKYRIMECESSHVSVIRVGKSKYRSNDGYACKKYPTSIRVDFSDGKSLWYEPFVKGASLEDAALPTELAEE